MEIDDKTRDKLGIWHFNEKLRNLDYVLTPTDRRGAAAEMEILRFEVEAWRRAAEQLPIIQDPLSFAETIPPSGQNLACKQHR